MKKLLILCMVLAMTSAAPAIPWFEVDPADQKSIYEPSDIITINLVEDGNVIGFSIDAITDNGAGGLASNDVFNPEWDIIFPVQGWNSNGMLIEYMGASQNPPITPINGVLYSFDYHVPEVLESTIIEIATYYDNDLYLPPFVGYKSSDPPLIRYDGHFESVMLQVIPEPATFTLLALGGLLLIRRK